MATLSDLVSVLAGITKLPEATVFAYGRFARETGHISQKGRGKGAAPMTVRDAANLLIAVGGTAVTREAGTAIEAFRPLRGRFLCGNDRGAKVIRKWLRPLGYRTTEAHIENYKYENFWLRADFGKFLEFLIERTIKNELEGILRSIPVLRDDTSATNYALSMFSVAAEALAETKSELKNPEDLVIGSDVGIRICFDRNAPAATVDFGNPYANTGVFSISFDKKPDRHVGDLQVEARISEFSIAAMAACLSDPQFPKLRKAGQYYKILFPDPNKSVEKLDGLPGKP